MLLIYYGGFSWRQVPASVLPGVVPTSPFMATPHTMIATPTSDHEAAEKAKRMNEVGCG